MARTSARLLELLSLFQTRRDWPGAELAARLGVSERTVRRDVDSLRELGYPVHVTRGPGGAYRLGPGTRLPPLLFDDDQAVAVALALQTTSSTVLGLGEAAERALATIREVMPAHLRHQVDAMQVTSIRSAWDMAAPRVERASIVGVGNAVRSREILRFDYAPGRTAASAQEGVPVQDGGRERVEPHHLVLWSARWYLVAYDLVRDRWQTYRLDRITPGERTGLRFTPRPLPAGSVSRYVRSQFDRGDSVDHWPCTGVAVVGLPAQIVARWAPGGARVEQLDQDRSRLTMGAWSWVGLAALLGTFDASIEIVGPPELTAAAGVLAERYRRAARGGDDWSPLGPSRETPRDPADPPSVSQPA